jgi:hypothetical protein
MRNVLSNLNAPRQTISEPKDRIPMAFINLKESRRFARPCPFKQKFVCGSLCQAALDSVGIVPTIITGIQLKDTVVEQKFAISAVSNTNFGKFRPLNRHHKYESDGFGWHNCCQTMALDAFRSQTVDGEIPRN